MLEGSEQKSDLKPARRYQNKSVLSKISEDSQFVLKIDPIPHSQAKNNDDRFKTDSNWNKVWMHQPNNIKTRLEKLRKMARYDCPGPNLYRKALEKPNKLSSETKNNADDQQDLAK